MITKKSGLRQIIERNKIYSPAIQAKTSQRPGENLERLAVIALKRVCVQLGVQYWK